MANKQKLELTWKWFRPAALIIISAGRPGAD
jgi:hypothetical protein